MAGFLSGKMKRKDVEEVYDGFSEFSLSSPAKKIRRLDAELPPIIEEEDPAVPMVFGDRIPVVFGNQQFPRDQINMPELGTAMTDEAVPVPALNEERALVLYKPVDAPLLLSPGQSNVSFRVSSDLIRGLKNQVFQSNNWMPIEDKSAVSDNCLAVVPWVPNQGPVVAAGSGELVSQNSLSQDPMESEEMESTSMEVEEDRKQATISGVAAEGLHQWQQHCMTQLPPNSSTPIMWSW